MSSSYFGKKNDIKRHTHIHMPFFLFFLLFLSYFKSIEEPGLCELSWPMSKQMLSQ